MLEDSPEGAWHAIGKHAPEVICHEGRFYMYFSGHPGDPIHEKHIAVAISESPEGPFRHFDGPPVLSPVQDGVAFDSLLIDDPVWSCGKVVFGCITRVEPVWPAPARF